MNSSIKMGLAKKILTSSVLVACVSLLGCSNTVGEKGKMNAPTLYTYKVKLSSGVPLLNNFTLKDNRKFLEEGPISFGGVPSISPFYPDTAERRLITVGLAMANFERNVNNIIVDKPINQIISSLISESLTVNADFNSVLKSTDVSLNSLWVSLKNEAWEAERYESTGQAATEAVVLGGLEALAISTDTKFGFVYNIDTTFETIDGKTININCSDSKYEIEYSVPEEELYERVEEMFSSFKTCINQKVKELK